MCVRTGASVYPKGVCGDPVTQTCSKQKGTASSPSPTTRELLFSDYAGNHTDGFGKVHVLCTGEDQCCAGGLWGDLVPAGERRGPAVVCRRRVRWL